MKMIAAALSVCLMGGIAEAAGSENLVRATPEVGARWGFEPGAEVWVAEPAPGPTEFFGSQPAMTRYAGTYFQGRLSSLTYGTGTGAAEMVYTGGDVFADAHIDLPSGVVLDEVRWWVVDSIATDIGFALIRSCLPTAGPGSVVNSVFSGTSSTGTGGTQSGTFTVPSVVVDNDTCVYFIRVIFGASGHTLQHVRLKWHRQVSAAPAVATFNDVPTGHFAFRFVEALAASGITGGCGAGTYCPDSPVTRAQMAIFLATALGLHFPN